MDPFAHDQNSSAHDDFQGMDRHKTGGGNPTPYNTSSVGEPRLKSALTKSLQPLWGDFSSTTNNTWMTDTTLLGKDKGKMTRLRILKLDTHVVVTNAATPPTGINEGHMGQREFCRDSERRLRASAPNRARL